MTKDEELSQSREEKRALQLINEALRQELAQMRVLRQENEVLCKELAQMKEQLQAFQGLAAKAEELSHLREENRALRQEKEVLGEELAQVKELLQSLQNRVAKDSHNSSLPPSSDRFVRQPKSLRKPTGKKPGGQKGHQGYHATFSPNPDYIQLHPVESCQHCHHDLRQTPATIAERRQVVNLPPRQTVITEHQVEEKPCPKCWHLTRASFPVGVRSAVQYGPEIQAIAVYLVQYQLIPYDRKSRSACGPAQHSRITGNHCHLDFAMFNPVDRGRKPDQSRSHTGKGDPSR